MIDIRYRQIHNQVYIQELNLRGTKKVDLLDPKSEVFEPTPNPTKNPIVWPKVEFSTDYRVCHTPLPTFGPEYNNHEH